MGFTSSARLAILTAMLFFGHIGITAGVFKTGETLLKGNQNATEAGNDKANKSTKLLSAGNNQPGLIDYRVVMIGSMLPDIIDKPMFMIFRNEPLSGRDYAHTLLFILILLILGVILNHFQKTWLLVMAISSFIHLVCDQMWKEPVTLFWPLLGPLLPGDRGVFLRNVFYNIAKPEVFIPEIVGIIILGYFAFKMVKRNSLNTFFTSGIINT